MKNVHSSDGIAEDMIRAICQYGASEAHIKTLIEKHEAKLKNGQIDPKDNAAIEKEFTKIDNLKHLLEKVADIRRKMMLKLYDMYKGDKDFWCLVKHLGEASTQTFEAFQGSDNDTTLNELWLEGNEVFIMALSLYLGIEITECAACFADMIKAKEGDK